MPLSARAFDTLLYLVERPNQLIDKQMLMKAVWPNAIVEENNLNQNISILRRALGETPGEHRFVVTVPARGLRFVPPVTRRAANPPEGRASALAQPPPVTPVEVVPALETEPNRQTSAKWLAVIAIATAIVLFAGYFLAHRHRANRTAETATSDATRTTSSSKTPRADASPANPRTSVAVMPFVNLTGDPGKEYFSDGMAEELINELTRVPGLKVPARTSSFAYKGRNIDARQIAHDLGVATILEGSVRSAGERIRVTAQLVNAETGYHLWSQTYDRSFGDVFKLEDDISAEIVEALKTSMNTPPPARVAQTPPTRDP